MNKLFIKIIVIILIFISLSILAMILTHSKQAIVTKGKLIEEKRETDLNTNIWGISHEIGKEEKLELTITQNVSTISDDIYKVDLLINQAKNKNYSIKNLYLSYIIDENDIIISNFYGIGNGEFKEGNISYKNGVAINCTNEGNYMQCTFIIKCNSAEHLYDTNAIDLSYDIVGHFPYTANIFYDIQPLEKHDNIS